MVDNEGEARFSAAVVLEGDCGEEEGVEVGGVYQEGRRKIGRDKEAWCDYTRKIMKELGLEEYWEKQDVEKIHKGEWRVIVGKKMQEKEQEEWKRRVESKSKLRTYRKVKTELETEGYLEEGTQERR